MTSPLLDFVASMIPELRDLAPSIEANRRVPAELSGRLGKAGLYRMLAPRDVGGGEVHPRVFAEVLETLGRGDGATAWVVMTGSTTGVLLAWLEPDAARSLLDEAPDAALAGVFAPMGRAASTDGGYRLTGRWPYGSGCENAHWRMGGAMVQTAAGPELRSMFFRASESVVHDTWHTSGLRGTGSHDFELVDGFVPDEHTASVTDPPRHDGALYRFPVFGLLATGVAAVGLGLARAALDDAFALCRTKRTRGGRKTMADSELVQVQLATAEGELTAARALVFQTLDQVWHIAQTGSIADEDRARLRLAATHAARTSRAVVDAACDLVGGAAIRQSQPFQRYQRDIDAMNTHIMVGATTYKPIGRILLGLPTDTTGL